MDRLDALQALLDDVEESPYFDKKDADQVSKQLTEEFNRMPPEIGKLWLQRTLTSRLRILKSHRSILGSSPHLQQYFLETQKKLSNSWRR